MKIKPYSILVLFLTTPQYCVFQPAHIGAEPTTVITPSTTRKAVKSDNNHKNQRFKRPQKIAIGISPLGKDEGDGKWQF